MRNPNELGPFATEENMETRSRGGGGAEQGPRKRARAGEPPPNGLYLVVEHQTENKCEVIKPSSHAGQPFGAPGMSFVAVNSKHVGDWIVGVGGRTTVTYDAGTSEVIQGPPVLSPKHQPILISHGGMLYAIARRPRVVPGTDFEPWFLLFWKNQGAFGKTKGLLAVSVFSRVYFLLLLFR